MTAILHATELAHFASMTAFVGLAVTLILGCFIIRFAPARRRAIADRPAPPDGGCRHRCPSENGAFVEELNAPRHSCSSLARPPQGERPSEKPPIGGVSHGKKLPSNPHPTSGPCFLHSADLGVRRPSLVFLGPFL